MNKIAKQIMITSLLLFIIFYFAQPMLADDESKKHGYLGVYVDPLAKKLERDLNLDYGVIVSRVVIDSPADEYGLTEDDVILKVNGTKIRKPHTLVRVVRKIEPGEKAKIELIRDGKDKTVEVVISEAKEEKSLSIIREPGEHKIAFFGNEGGYLGVQLQELNEDLAPYFDVKPGEGALILEVEADSPAEEAGIKVGDVIVKIGDEQISDSEDVQEIISDLEPEEKVDVTFVRQKKMMTLSVVLGERKGLQKFFISPPGKHNWHYKHPSDEELFFKFKKGDDVDKKVKKIIIKESEEIESTI